MVGSKLDHFTHPVGEGGVIGVHWAGRVPRLVLDTDEIKIFVPPRIETRLSGCPAVAI